VATVHQTTSSVTVGGSLAGWELALLIAVVAAGAIGITWPLTRAWARRIVGRPLDNRLAETEHQLELALDRLSRAEAHLEELEQRVEFAERLLPAPGAPVLPDATAPTRRVTTPRP
jgi:hypothetical protein